ncbi:restriction endonuclease subunit S [Phocaeicola vulgatus]|uniref:restriction endonuclease subunit S n=1 Tax=Phocaeicola vulgatus TaxID=821 RepID=UPI001EEDC706|nr:restriction endonuclease subunit S [Phocaeicola vulgatus]MCG0202835.1 restriction endonuclease subunit S [Phocaeicola vulgatus]
MAIDNKEKEVLNVPHLRFPEFSGEWKKHSLGEIGETIIGLTYKPSDVVDNNGIIVFRSSNIKNGMIDYSDLVRVNKYIKDKIITKENDILVCARNGSQRLIGKNAIIKQEDANNTFGAFMMVYRANDNPFILPLLSTNKYFSQVGENLGARINQITTSDFNGFEFYFPENHAERTKIAELFRLLDERIATQNKIIEKLQSLIKGLNDNIHKGIKGETVCFSDLGEAYSGLSGKGGDDFGYGEPFITYMNVYQNTYISEKDYELVQIAPNEKQNSVQYGDALFTLSSETPEEVGIGAVYLGNTQKLYLNSFCFGIHFYDERVLPQYLAHFISSSSFRRAIYPLAQGSTRFNLQKNDFMKMKFLLPSLEKQGHIANTLDALHCRLANEKSLTEQYILLKKYLLSLMFI